MLSKDLGACEPPKPGCVGAIRRERAANRWRTGASGSMPIPGCRKSRGRPSPRSIISIWMPLTLTARTLIACATDPPPPTCGAPTIVSGKLRRRQSHDIGISGLRGAVTKLGHSGCGIVGIHTGLQMLADTGPQLPLQRPQRREQPRAMEDNLLASRIFVGESCKILFPIEHFRPPSDHVLRWQRINASSESIERHWRNWLP